MFNSDNNIKAKHLVIRNENTSDVVVDLQLGSSAQINVARYKIDIDLPRWKDKKGNFKLEIEPEINMVEKNNLVIDTSYPMLEVGCSNFDDTNTNVVINDDSFVYVDVFFNMGTIIDCVDQGLSGFNIKYVLKCECKDETVVGPEGRIKVRLKDLAPAPEIIPEFTTLRYEAGIVEAKIRIKSSSDKLYAPRVSMRINEIYLDNGHDRLHIISIDRDGVKPIGVSKRPQGILGPDEGYHMTYINEKNVMNDISDSMLEMPIRIDIGKLPNPIDDYDEYNIVVDFDYWLNMNSNDPTTICNQRILLPLSVEKNKGLVGLQIDMEVQYASGYIMDGLIFGDYSISKDKPVYLNEDARGGYRVVMKNTATVRQVESPNAGIIIRRFTCDNLSYGDGCMAYQDNGDRVEIDKICSMRLSGCAINDGQSRIFPAESINIDWMFDGSNTRIAYLINKNGERVYASSVGIDVAFDYFVDETGNANPQDDEYTHFSGRISIPVELMPRSEWLGVDFGTSAVVALYGTGIDNEGNACDCIKNLENIKREGLRRLYKDRMMEEYRKMDSEKIFINSKIVVGDDYVNGEEVIDQFEDLNKAKIMFSPGAVFKYDHLLPSLKSMMGYQNVPWHDRNAPLVEKVYEMAYTQMFNLYLKGLSDGDPIEKIVMTYPNTFAVSHIKKLQKLAKQCLPSLRDDYIVTVSESDAVAYRYLMCRDNVPMINHFNNLNEPVCNWNYDIDKYVMVYDMGAGTLDITYFNKTEKDGVQTVDILGKFGINKAGNYLDYVLAEVIVDIIDEYDMKDSNGENKFRDYIDFRDNKLDIDTRAQLKNYVKDIIKPLMAQYETIDAIPEDLMLPEWEHQISGEKTLSSVPLRKVFGNKRFTNFVKEISIDVINNCDDSFGINKDSAVVLFSGRMSSMKIIRSAVISALQSKVKNVVDVDIASIDMFKNGDANVLKTAVINGAFNYVEYFIGGGAIRLAPRKPFYTRFCIIARDFHGSKVYSIVNNTMQEDKFQCTAQVDLTNVSALYLVQTYATRNEDIINDFNEDRNLTTVLGYRNTTNIRGMHAISVTVTCGSGEKFSEGIENVGLWIDHLESKMLPHENINSVAFRKSAWPIVFKSI